MFSSWLYCWVFLYLWAVGVVMVSGCVLFLPLMGEGVSGLCSWLIRGLVFWVGGLSGPFTGCVILGVILFSECASIPIILGIYTVGISEMVVVRV